MEEETVGKNTMVAKCFCEKQEARSQCDIGTVSEKKNKDDRKGQYTEQRTQQQCSGGGGSWEKWTDLTDDWSLDQNNNSSFYPKIGGKTALSLFMRVGKNKNMKNPLWSAQNVFW